jgi:TonB family protein
MPQEIHDDTAGFDRILTWREPVGSRRLLTCAIVSISFHILLFGIFLALPATHFRYQTRAVVTVDKRKAVPLIAPRSLELTQRDPNEGKVRQELDVRSMLPAAPKPRSFRPPAPSGPAVPQTPLELAAAPQIQSELGVPQIAGGPPAALPGPLNQPKQILENIGPPPPDSIPENPRIKMPQVSVEDAARAAARGGPGGGLGSSGSPGAPAAVGEMQLLSDPLGVDFKPYLAQVLTTVRRNWFAVIPPAARTGRQGLVLVQFIIDRRGSVPKLVIAAPSGTSSFDRAAVAAVSASYPFRPLPSEYKGDEIRLQLAFSYNIPNVR